VHDLAQRLLKAYTVEGGNVHLAGCTLDEFPVVCVGTDPTMPSSYVIFGQADEDHRPVDSQMFDTLGLHDLSPAQPPPTVSPRELDRLVQQARNLMAPGGDHGERPGGELVIVWCKFARGKIQFTISNATAHTSFAGWSRVVEAPPYRCATTGVDVFSVAVTSDGRVIAKDELATCDVSGRRLPRCEMVRCASTGKFVAETLAAKCPVTGQRSLRSTWISCSMCQQEVGPTALQRGRCAACRRLTPVSRDDNRILKILKQHPRLSAWQWLRLSETDAIYILVAAGFFQRRLLVLDRNSLAIVHAARSTRGSQRWTSVSPTDEESLW
jgi:hypothetical protein